MIVSVVAVGLAAKMGELQRFRHDMARLGGHPDKALINQLTYFAEVNKRSRGKEIAHIIGSAVLSVSVPIQMAANLTRGSRAWRQPTP